MDNNTKKINLGVVQETLLLPLAARAYDANSKNPMLNDTKALQLFNSINNNTNEYKKYLRSIGIAGLCERAIIMDNTIRAFINKHPKGKVLNIGVGLETSYYRLNEPNIAWYDLDLPDSIALRKKLLPIPNKNVQYISKSMFDSSWIDDICSIDNGLLITVPGVFMYFDESQVKDFFVQFAPKLKNAEIVFDVISNMGRFFIGWQVKRAGMKNATMDWGIINPKEMEMWSKHIKYIHAHTFGKKLPNIHKLNWFDRLTLQQNYFFKVAQIFHFKFI